MYFNLYLHLHTYEYDTAAVKNKLYVWKIISSFVFVFLYTQNHAEFCSIYTRVCIVYPIVYSNNNQKIFVET